MSTGNSYGNPIAIRDHFIVMNGLAYPSVQRPE